TASGGREAVTSSARLRISPTGIGPGGFAGGVGLGAGAPAGADVPAAGVLGAAGAVRPGTFGICPQASVMAPRHRTRLAIHTAAGFLRDSSWQASTPSAEPGVGTPLA